MRAAFHVHSCFRAREVGRLLDFRGVQDRVDVAELSGSLAKRVLQCFIQGGVLLGFHSFGQPSQVPANHRDRTWISSAQAPPTFPAILCFHLTPHDLIFFLCLHFTSFRKLSGDHVLLPKITQSRQDSVRMAEKTPSPMAESPFWTPYDTVASSVGEFCGVRTRSP